MSRLVGIVDLVTLGRPLWRRREWSSAGGGAWTET